MSTAKKKDLNSLGDIYGDMLNGIKRSIVKESKVKEGEIGEAPLLKGGPDEKGGFVPSKIDRNKLSKKELEDNLYNIKDLSYSAEGDNEEEDEEEIPQESRKIARESLNNFMSKKSIFDRLYENVIGQEEPMGDTAELDALGIESGEDEGGDEVTFTLDRETAQKLHDVLMTVLGGDEGEGEDEVETETETEEDYEYDMDEDEEELGHAGVNAKEPDMGKNNKVGNLKPQSGGAVSKYTDKVGNDGDYGHALVNAKQPNMGKSNKVGSLKPGKSLFEQ